MIYCSSIIWVGLLDRLLLSNPSDLPCYVNTQVYCGNSTGELHMLHLSILYVMIWFFNEIGSASDLFRLVTLHVSLAFWHNRIYQTYRDCVKVMPKYMNMNLNHISFSFICHVLPQLFNVLNINACHFIHCWTWWHQYLVFSPLNPACDNGAMAGCVIFPLCTN